MRVRVSLDHPRRHIGRRLWQPIARLAGAALLVAGIAASLVAVPTSVLAVGWLMDEPIDLQLEPGRTVAADQILLAWGISTPLAIFGVSRGLRLVRGRRSLVLFLRRFGYDDATNAVTFAVTKTIGNSWRLVTLDDAEIAPVGVSRGTFWFVRIVDFLYMAILRPLWALARLFPYAQLGLWIIVGIDLVRARIWERAQDGRAWATVLEPYIGILTTGLDGRLPFDALEWNLHGAFALLMIFLAGFVLAIGTALAASPLAWGVATVFGIFFRFPADAVLEAERAKKREIRTERDIAAAVRAVVDKSRKVFGPRLVVLRVASAVWREAVTRFASASSMALIDVSEPTEHLVWEIEELTLRGRTTCIFIGQHERVARLAAPSPEAGPYERRVAQLLEWQEVLAYTPDRHGKRRFARALRNKLLSVSYGDDETLAGAGDRADDRSVRL